MCYAQCCHGDGSGVRHVHIKYHGQLRYYQATVLYCCHDDGSDGRHVCSQYHSHTHYYQATIYKLDADSRKLRGDVESRGPWSCSGRAQRGRYYRAQGFLIPRVVSANQRLADLESWQRRFRKKHSSTCKGWTSWSAVVFTWLTHQPEGEDAILSAAHRCKRSEAASASTSPAPKPRPQTPPSCISV